ncbi:MAG: metalloprotease PmbA [Kangiellaceae bacterium]|nr:metalloprotease PmbA [Kangiellaceae bacterium]
MKQVEQLQAKADEIDVKKEIEFFESATLDLVNYAKSKGASQVEIGVSKDIGLSVTVRNQEIETLEYNRDNSFGISVYLGKQKGVATTSDLSVSSLRMAVDAALNIAKFTQPDEFSGLADESLMAQKEVDLKLDNPMGIDAEQAKSLALECEEHGLAYSNKISNSEGASFSSHRNIRYYTNSHGFKAASPSTRHSVSCVLLAEDSLGKQRDHWYSVSRDFNDLEAVKIIGEKAAQRTISRLNGRQIKTQKAKVLFVPEMARTLIGHFKAAISGANIYRKSSFLLEGLDKQIFPEFLSMNEKPFIEKGFASAWHDNEGLATRERMIVENGTINNFLLNSYSARKLGMQPTGHGGGVHNLQLTSTGSNFDELVKSMNTGLIVTEMMGHGVNMITGDYSRGASGFWVENGEIQYFVQEITIAGNLKEMFASVVAVGNDFDYRSSVLTGSWLLPEMMIAGS